MLPYALSYKPGRAYRSNKEEARMKLNHTALGQTGNLLYGPASLAPLAEALGVNVRTLRRWLKGEYPIPDGIWPELAELCDKQSQKLDDQAEAIELAMADK